MVRNNGFARSYTIANSSSGGDGAIKAVHLNVQDNRAFGKYRNKFEEKLESHPVFLGTACFLRLILDLFVYVAYTRDASEEATGLEDLGESRNGRFYLHKVLPHQSTLKVCESIENFS